MADIILEITIPSAKVTKAAQGYLAVYPNNETIPDPAWIDPEDGSMVSQIPKYTTKQWVEEKLMRILIRDVHRGLQKLVNAESIVEIDNDIATRT